MTAHLAVIDMQRVFGDAGSAWATPRFAEIVPRIRVLAEALAPKVTFTRFVAPDEPAGAWSDYYARWPFARLPRDAPLYELVPDFAGPDPSLDATTFSKWGPELSSRVGPDVLVLAGVSTDCCVLSTAVAAADAGVPVRVVADACAGVDDRSHAAALHVLGLYSPLVEVVDTATVLDSVRGRSLP
ncbi:cysteine hydrolase family protein [Pseudonocardia alaniniphila]|uniref:Cysteine hydrolase n=1 Tax=Pseudonocardia alaniniphila TaxID=75291 RepID=A0ABS9TUL6_9PSEU|nr:cysteine hydrolase [Pseudonocardia alaniniphila]MCH6172043.1 cysteine hydrolase [Pseudonocardia alaniniphila]